MTDPQQHALTASSTYPSRDHEQYIKQQLDLRPGDAVVDIGAGDGWWTERIAQVVGEAGTVHAAEVDSSKVAELDKKFSGTPQVKPYLSRTDGTGLPENSCELAFFSQVYHHIDRHTEVDYLRHLATVVKPTGRLCIIEKYPIIATRSKPHGTPLSLLAEQAEEAGWVPVRYELLTGTYHFLAIFVPRGLFAPEPASEGRSQNRGRSGVGLPGMGSADAFKEALTTNLAQSNAVPR